MRCTIGMSVEDAAPLWPEEQSLMQCRPGIHLPALSYCRPVRLIHDSCAHYDNALSFPGERLTRARNEMLFANETIIDWLGFSSHLP